MHDLSTPPPPAGNEQIHLHALCWNEARMIPYFFRHYNELVDRFFIHDCGSTDGSVEQLAGEPRVTVIPCAPGGDSVFEAEQAIANESWKLSRGTAQWVFVVDMSEHLHHPALPQVLRNAAADGASAVKLAGYEMIGDEFPSADQPLARLLTRGVRFPQLDKLAVFSPDAVTETNYAPGRHTADPTGRIAWETRHPIALLRYERLGVDYVCERNRRLAARLRPGDLARNYGLHYRIAREGVAAQQVVIARTALPLPSLDAAAGTTDRDMDEEMLALRRSGLFQDAWYLARYPDVAAAGIDPLEHFCRSGWREARQPNAYFDPAWYQSAYGALIGDVNPLLDYAIAGEQLGRKPARDFDPMEYRFRHGLPCAESPLLHRLREESESDSAASLAPAAS